MFVFVLLYKTKNLRICVCKKTGNSIIFVFVLSKKCAQTTKSLRKKAVIFVYKISLYRQNYEGKNIIND